MTRLKWVTVSNYLPTTHAYVGVTFSQAFLDLLLADIQIIDVSLMVLAVVDLHNLRGDVGGQGSIVVRQVRQGMLRQGSTGGKRTSRNSSHSQRESHNDFC